MKRTMLTIAASLTALAYSHGRTETVMVKRGKSGDPFRINKADFDADQADGGENAFTEVKSKATEASKGTRSDVNQTNEGGVQTTAAPSAPDFTRGDDGANEPIDPVKAAVAPASTTADQLLVMKDGKKYFITDGVGTKITGDRAKLLKIDPKGYDSEEAAKAVQTHTNPEPSPNN